MKALSVLLAACLLLAPMTVAGVPVGDTTLLGAQDGPTVDDATSSTTDPFASLQADDDESADDVQPDDGNETDGENEAGDGNDTRVNVLGPPREEPTLVSLTSHRANFGPATGLETAATTAAIETEAIVAHVEAADSESERQRRLVAAESEIRQAELSLYERQQQAIAAHADGEISDQELLIELAVAALTAEVLGERLDRIDEIADETPGFSLGADGLAFRLNVYDGPVRTYAVETLRGETDPDRIYVETQPDVVVLAVIDDDEYVREVYRGDRWDRSADSVDDESERALDRTLEAYPRVDERSLSADTLGTSGVTRVTIPFDNGELQTFVSGGDGDVFIEHQRRGLEAFDDSDTLETTQDGITLTVDRTYPGGPVRITAIDEETGVPVRGASVTVAIGDADSVEVGTTNRDGVLWTISPGSPYRVTVVDDPRVSWIPDIQPADLPRTIEASSEEEEDASTS